MKHIVGLFAWIFGFVTLLLVMSSFILLFQTSEVPIAIPETPAYYEAIGEAAGKDFAILLVGIPLLFLSAYLFSLRNRLSKKRIDVSAISIEEPFILYLRTFADDAKTARTLSWISGERTEEEETVDALSDIADVYAIGDPRDKKMPHGAIRVYVDDEHWKDTVFDLARRSELVVLRIGRTSNFWWEVEMALSNIPVYKLLFIVPSSQTFSSVSELYKLLLQHNVDISTLDLSIKKAYRGSISSFLSFDENGTPHCASMSVPRFTKFFFSYSSAIRVALQDFRASFHLSPYKGANVRWSRVFQIILVLYFPIVGAMHCFGDVMSIKYQRPYELAELCVSNNAFSKNHGESVDGSTLLRAITDSRRGLIAIPDAEYAKTMVIETEAMKKMDAYELQQLTSAPYNMLLLIKKYCPGQYQEYVRILGDAAILYNKDNEEVEHLIRQYQSMVDDIPRWLIDLAADVDDDDMESVLRYSKVVISRLEERDVVKYIKVSHSLLFDD